MNSQQIPILPLSRVKRFYQILTNYFRLSELQIQENAGRILSALVRELYGSLEELHVAIAVGLDFKAGVALAAARFLQNKGSKVTTLLIGRPENEASEMQLEIFKKMNENLHVLQWPTLETVDVIIDGIAGFTLFHPPSGRMKDLIELVSCHDRPIMSIEIPSGLGAMNGKPLGTVIKARDTVALGIPKEPLFMEGNKKYVGSVYLADVGIPLAAYHRLGLEMPNLFAEVEVIRLSSN